MYIKDLINCDEMIPEISKINDSSNSDTDYEIEPNFDDAEDFVDNVNDEGMYHHQICEIAIKAIYH